MNDVELWDAELADAEQAAVRDHYARPYDWQVDGL